MSTTESLAAPRYVDLPSHGMSMSPKEFDAIEDWDEFYRYELIDGILVVSPPPGMGERSPNDDLGHLIRTYQESHGNGSCVDDTAPEHTIPVKTQRRRADRAIWIGLGHKPLRADDLPAIVIEFTSKSARDRCRDYEEKRREYAEVGIVEYWVIDRFDRTMTVFSKGDAQVVREEHTYETDLMPGFKLPLRRLLELAASYDNAEN